MTFSFSLFILNYLSTTLSSIRPSQVCITKLMHSGPTGLDALNLILHTCLCLILYVKYIPSKYILPIRPFSWMFSAITIQSTLAPPSPFHLFAKLSYSPRFFTPDFPPIPAMLITSLFAKLAYLQVFRSHNGFLHYKLVHLVAKNIGHHSHICH